MRVRVPLVVLLVGVILALTPLAYVEAPDEIWHAGFFDDDDQDDAIVSVQMHLNAVEPPVLVRLRSTQLDKQFVDSHPTYPGALSSVTAQPREPSSLPRGLVVPH